jgi:hypothetical protein
MFRFVVSEINEIKYAVYKSYPNISSPIYSQDLLFIDRSSRKYNNINTYYSYIVRLENNYVINGKKITKATNTLYADSDKMYKNTDFYHRVNNIDSTHTFHNKYLSMGPAKEETTAVAIGILCCEHTGDIEIYLIDVLLKKGETIMQYIQN